MQYSVRDIVRGCLLKRAGADLLSVVRRDERTSPPSRTWAVEEELQAWDVCVGPAEAQVDSRRHQAIPSPRAAWVRLDRVEGLPSFRSVRSVESHLPRPSTTSHAQTFLVRKFPTSQTVTSFLLLGAQLVTRCDRVRPSRETYRWCFLP